MHVNVFAYGTLRTHPALEAVHGLDILNWDPTATKVGHLGEWVLDDRCMCHDGYVPAVGTWHDPERKVYGDVYRISLDGFREILHYEGFPSLYGYEVLTLRSTTDPDTTVEAVVFTTSRADQFGPPSLSGDYFNKEAGCDLTSRS